MNCGKPFTSKKSKERSFCSIKCKNEFEIKQEDNSEYEEQWEIDFKARKKAKERDFRYQERRI